MPTEKYLLEQRRRATITHVQNLITTLQEQYDEGIVAGMSNKRQQSLYNRIAHLRDRLGKLEIAQYRREMKEMKRMYDAMALTEIKDETLADYIKDDEQDASARPYKTDEF